MHHRLQKKDAEKVSFEDEVLGAIETTPLYRELYNDCFGKVYRAEWASLPTISKQDIVKNFPFNFFSPLFLKAKNEKLLEYTSTSGTTTDRMQIMRRKNWWKDEYERTSYCNNFLRRFNLSGGRKAILTTAVCSNTVCYLKSPSYQERIINGTLYLNSTSDPNSWTCADVARICDEIDVFKPNYIDADPVYLAMFFKKAVQFGVPLPTWRPDFVTLSYEFVSDNCRRIISTFWSVPVFNLYGSTETGYLFCECENHKFHSVQHDAKLEFIPVSKRPEVAQICVTSLKNEYMPLIRYLVGDLVSVEKCGNDRCSCGATGFVQIDKLMGRTKDAFINGDGTFITLKDIDEVVSPVPNILIYKIDCRDPKKILFRYVSFDDCELPLSHADKIGEGLRVLFGANMDIQFKREAGIPPEQSGKFKLVVSE